MSSPKAERLKGVFGWLFAGVFMFVGLVFLGIGAYELWQGLKTQSWPATPGKIIESEIESRTRNSRSSSGGSRRRTNYSVKVRYAYEVAGEKLEGNRLQYGYDSHDQRSSAKEEQSRYPVGKEVDVYYDPTDTKTSVLVKGSGDSWLVLGVGSLAVVSGLGVMIYMTRMSRARVREQLAAG